MATLRSGQTTDFSNQGTEFTVDNVDTDGAQIKETFYIPDFKKWNGFYRTIPELRSVINKFGSWTFGRKIIADAKNKKKLDRIRGIGRESARSVLKNQWIVAMVCGDSFAHKIRDDQGRLTNLKPLNPGHVAIVANEQGIIVAYEQKTSVQGETIRYDVDEIYHLMYMREADEIHGIPFPEALEILIASRNEGIADLRVLYHRTVKPILFYETKTTDTAKINSLEDTINKAFKNSESVIIAEGTLGEIKRSSSPMFSTGEVNSLAYIKFLVRLFITGVGMPEIVMGWGEETTEASSKVIITSYEQEIWDMKLYNEEAAEIQLNIKFTIEPAPSIMDTLVKDQNKDGAEKPAKPNDRKLTATGDK
jgi:hypothetical protein